MLDPFPFTAPIWLQQATTPLATALSLPTLPLHIHEVIFSIGLYTFIGSYLSPVLSSTLCPQTYPHLNKRTRINWDVHVVSMFQSILVCVLALWVTFTDTERKEMDYRERIWGYTGGCGVVQGMATGYFIWDLVVTARYINIFGWGMLAHAVAATTVFMLGFRPFVNYYGPIFILYELSSPFNNIHWFLDKLSLTGSTVQWINGICLITVFFSCRLVWGALNSVYVFHDIWQAYNHGAMTGTDSADLGLRRGLDQNALPKDYGVAGGAAGAYSAGDEVMRFAQGASVPLWLAGSYLFSNIVLNLLNYYWMGKMIETIRKRFDPPWGTKGVSDKREEKVKADGTREEPHKVEIQRGVYDDGRKTVEIEGSQVRSRRRG